MSWSIVFRGLRFRLAVLGVLLLAAAGLLRPAPPARAADEGVWSVDILAQSDSRAELRPCT